MNSAQSPKDANDGDLAMKMRMNVAVTTLITARPVREGRRMWGGRTAPITSSGLVRAATQVSRWLTIPATFLGGMMMLLLLACPAFNQTDASTLQVDFDWQMPD